DGSTVNTAGIDRARGARVVDCHHRQSARVRNTGARASTGDILIFVDADTLVSAAAARASLDAIAAGAVGGGATLDVEGTLPWWGPPVLWGVGGVMLVMHWEAGCYVVAAAGRSEGA